MPAEMPRTCGTCAHAATEPEAEPCYSCHTDVSHPAWQALKSEPSPLSRECFTCRHGGMNADHERCGPCLDSDNPDLPAWESLA